MNHRDATEHLLDLAEGSLDAELRSAVASHAETCASCREWLETFDLLSAHAPERAIAEHPSSDVLALCAVRPEEIYEVSRADLLRHLERCPDCARDLALLRAAVEEAKPSAPAEPVSPLVRFRLPSGSRRRLAAAVAVLAIAASILVGLRYGGSGSWADESPTRSAAVPTTVEGVTAVEVVDGDSLAGTRVIEAPRGLQISRTKVKEGSRITLRAGEGIAFGDGFQVEGNASLAVEAGSKGGTKAPS